MSFIYPQMLWLFALMIPVIIAWSFISRWRDGRLAAFTARENWDVLNRNVSKRARFHKGLFVMLALAFSIVAAARPWWGTVERTVSRSGTSVIFAVDVSDSMRATDLAPNRLEYAKTIVRQILAESPGNRVGIMPFAGAAFLQVPLTSDYGVVLDSIRALDQSTIGYPGTDIPNVIDKSIEAFDRGGVGNRTIVVITDGEDHSDEIAKAAKRAAEKEIRIIAVGIGSETGSPIRMQDGSFKEAGDGTKVLSRMNPGILRDLAEETGGVAFVPGASGELNSSPIAAEINRLEKETLGEAKRVIKEERYQWPLALALLCLIIDGMISDRRHGARTKSRPRKHVVKPPVKEANT